MSQKKAPTGPTHYPLLLRTSFAVAPRNTGGAQSITTIGGNPIVERNVHDFATNLYILDTNHPFTASGPVDSWEIYADTTNPVQLVIYRQKGGVFQEVGRSNMMTPTLGYNLFHLAQPIIVQAGDFVGAFQPNGGISYTDYFGSGTNLGHTTLASTTTSTAFYGSFDRTYSLRALHSGGN